jgi:hypothetical protein
MIGRIRGTKQTMKTQNHNPNVQYHVTTPLIAVPATIIPILTLYTQFRLNGTFVGIWLAHTGFGLPLTVFFSLKRVLEAIHRSIKSGPSAGKRVALSLSPVFGPGLERKSTSCPLP